MKAGPGVGSIVRVSFSLKSRAGAMRALWPARADDLKHQCTLPRGLGSASETYCPARLGPGGAFFIQRR
jgi:hypothetical protein